jgi:beta-phosphoglucomutase-like phosphatase (HAD superfamily)
MGRAPADCLVIEDSLAGVTAARAAGMAAIGFIGGGHTYPGHAEKLRAAGAGTVCATWDDVEGELSRLDLIAPVSA